MDPQNTNPQDNRQEEPSKRGIQIPNVFGRRRLGTRLVVQAASTLARFLAFLFGGGGPVVIALGILLLFTFLIIFFGIPAGGIPVSGDEPTPTPNPISACPPGTNEKTISIAQSVAPLPPPPTSVQGCIGADQSCNPGGTVCCSSLSCQFDSAGEDRDNFTCKTNVPPPQPSSLALKTTSIGYQYPNRCPSGDPSTSFVSQKNNIPINHTRLLVQSACARMEWRDTTNEAILNFAGFNIPKNSEIKSALLSSSASGACEAAFVSGRTGNSGPFPPSATRFGSGAMLLLDKIKACLSRNPVFPTKVQCGGSGLPSGAADIKSIISGLIANQSVASLSFKITPENSDWLCFTPDQAYTLFSGSFSINNSGPANLAITYCENPTN